ncbi:MAG TPA: NAD(P)H-dependent oxidoreductase [Jatrophihabitantaceae bacterium]|jgi:FMN reductase|nr:NAD(P)H-dependent oxidoreductase [Jatrophihabitantaceae bacterium]
MGDASDGKFVVGIGGSTNADSVTSVLLRIALGMVAEQGAETASFGADAMMALPMYAPPGESADPAPNALVDAVRRADAVIISTPGYHGAMSGLVKNAVDHLEALRDDDRPYLEGRPVGLIVAAGGWQACGTTLVSARSVVHSLRGWPTPLGVTVNSFEQQSGPDGRFDERVRGGLRIMSEQLIAFMSWHGATKSPLEIGEPARATS